MSQIVKIHREIDRYKEWIDIITICQKKKGVMHLSHKLKTLKMMDESKIGSPRMNCTKQFFHQYVYTPIINYTIK